MHSRFLPFLSSAVELPASCAGAVLCGRLPHRDIPRKLQLPCQCCLVDHLGGFAAGTQMRGISAGRNEDSAVNDARTRKKTATEGSISLRHECGAECSPERQWPYLSADASESSAPVTYVIAKDEKAITRLRSSMDSNQRIQLGVSLCGTAKPALRRLWSRVLRRQMGSSF